MAVQILEKVKKESDLDSLVNLAFQSFKSPSGYKNVKDAEGDLCSLLYSLKHSLLLAYDSETFVGFSLHGPTVFEEPLYRRAATATKCVNYNPNNVTISMIAVIPEETGKGIGKKLVEKVMEESKNAGAQQVYVTCFGGKGGSSYKMFKSLVYVELSTRCYHYKDGSEGVIMYKEL